MSSLKAPEIRVGDEPIAGYRLEERIGSGGFGEVWRCNAPGNLKKAIKFVFGSHDDSRGRRERKSLERVRGVRHPFLLTLERFEVVEDRLVIVTELADGSLEDIYREYRDRGSCGVPRKVLMKHLGDAADGLDHLHQEFRLQHLDVKPGNLLMVGGHVKVADFGLLKDLRDGSCSVVGGLTPVYAPPELFDGRPSVHSDQYSLAVMYQELLTGTRPFAGRTIAQLATQHVHATPNLEPLPPRDRAVIAKALEKNPENRFGSCAELIDALRSPTPTVVASSPVTPGADVRNLPAINATDAGASPDRPNRSVHAVVIGLGGFGAEVVGDLRRRIADVHDAGPVRLTPILIDIDSATIHAAAIGDASQRLPRCRTIHTPMKSSHEYRRDTTGRLRSVSRRWIYNVPRSGRPEGLRTMGRLALLDHAEAVFDVIREVVDGHRGAEELKVYVAASIAGATGSGMYMDVVHEVRSILDRAERHGVPVRSLLATPPVRLSTSDPLPSHNAHAALIEIEHFLDAGNGYPGDPGAGLASVPAARTPLRDAYLICGDKPHEGAGGLDPAGAGASGTAAAYIWTDAGVAGNWLAKVRSRDAGDESASRGPTLRSVGLVSLGEGHALEEQMLAPPVVLDVMRSWLGRPDTDAATVASAADRLARRVGLVAGTLRSLIEPCLGSAETKTDDASAAGSTTHPTTATVSAGGGGVVRSDTIAALDGVAASLAAAAVREVASILADGRQPLTVMIGATQMLSDRRIELSHAPELATIDGDAVARVLDHVGTELEYTIQRLETLTAIVASAVVRGRKESNPASDPWNVLPETIRGRRSTVVGDLRRSAASACLIRPLCDPHSDFDTDALIGRLTRLALPVVIGVVRGGGDVDPEPPPGGGSQSPRTEPIDQTQDFDTSPPTRRGTDTADNFALARPGLVDFGGSLRTLLLIGSEPQRGPMVAKVREVYDGPLTTAVVPGCDPTLIQEAQSITVGSILARMEVMHGESNRIIGRLAGRVDIDWKTPRRG